MSNVAVNPVVDDPLTREYVEGFLVRLQKRVMSVHTQSIDILESMSLRFLRTEMQAISYPQTLGAIRLEAKLCTMVNDPVLGEAARFYLNPPFWFKTKAAANNSNLL